MDAEGLKLKIDTKEAQQDLAALSKMINKTAKSADNLDAAFARMASSASANLGRAAKSMEKYAQVAALLSKIKVAGNPVGQIQEMAKALDAVARVRLVNEKNVGNIRELGHALQTLRAPERVMGVSVLLNSIGRAKIPTQAQARNLREFFVALNSYKGTPGTTQLDKLLATLASLKAPSASSIKRIEQMFAVLANAKSIPNADKIVRELDQIAGAATRASGALSRLPRGGLGGGLGTSAGRGPVAASGRAASTGARALGSELETAERSSSRARAEFQLLGNGLGDLSGRFRLSYQAGTLLSAMFASFTIGQFIKGIYEANIQLLKLQKAVLFSTGTFDGAATATDRYISMSQELGLSIKDNIETYGRFVIASKASNMTLGETNSIYHALGQALTVVGANATQQQLAFYGLTEMLQKGVVYSKEFNRQIGAQLPGNAILGARALSELEHHTVSVTEFFRRMHTGTLLSPQFVPEWAKQVEAMYHPLLALAQARPDVAITRLSNSFFLFAREVGSGKFMTAIGGEITKLMNKFVTLDKDGIAHLTPQAQKLADTLGNGLATSIHVVGNVLGFLIDHFESLMFLFKGFVAFEIGREIQKIAGAAGNAADNFFKWGTATREVAAAEASVTAASASSGLAPGLNIAERLAGRSRVLDQERRASALSTGGRRVYYGNTFPAGAAGGPRPAAAYAVGANRIRLLNPSIRDQLARRSIAASVASGGSEFSLANAARGAASAAGTGITGLANSIRFLGPLAIAAGVALAVFGDKISGVKSAAGQDVTYNDIASGTFDTITEQINGFLTGVGASFGAFGSNAFTLGKAVALVAATIKSVFDLLFDLAHAIGVSIGTGIANAITVIVSFGRIIYDVFHGNFSAAYKDIKSGATQLYQNSASGLSAIGSDLAKPFTTDTIGSNYAKIIAAAGNNADDRTHTNAKNEIDQKALEAALRQQNAAAIIEAAAQRFQDATVGMSQLTQPLDADKVLANLRSLGNGNIAAGASPSDVAALGPGANQGLRSTLMSAASQAGISAQSLFDIGMAESRFSPDQYHSDKPGRTAAGPFQITQGTYKDLSSRYGAFDRYSVGGSALAAARLIASNHQAGVNATGRELDSGEDYLMYVLGSGAGSKFLKQYDTNPNADAAKMFGAAATANRSLFYDKDAKGQRTVPLTLQQVYANFMSRVGRWQKTSPDSLGTIADGAETDLTGGTNPLGATQTGGDEDKLDKVARDQFKIIQGVISKGSPQAAAQGELQNELTTLEGVREKLEKSLASESPFAKTFLSDKSIMDGVVHAIDMLKKKVTEANDPIANIVRLQRQQNDVTALRVKGLGDEADMQAEINKLVEQGYTPLQASLMLTTNKALFTAEQERTRTLQTQLDVAKQLLDIDTKRAARLSNSPLDNAVNAGIAQAALPGDTSLADVRRHLSPDHLAAITQGAQASVSDNASTARQGLTESITELQGTYGLNPTAKSLRDDYKKALQDITGLSTDSLARLNLAASDADKQFAANYANLKHDLENPPGFQRWVDGLEPLSKRLEDIKYSFAEDLSNGITDALSGDKVDVDSMLKDLRKQWLHAQVDNALGGLMGALGITKPATPEDAMSAASTTFSSGADTFANAVVSFSSVVGAAAGSPVTGAAALATAGGGGIPGLRGSIFDDSAPTGSITGDAGSNLGLGGALLGDSGAATTLAGTNATGDSAGSGFWGGLGKLVGWNDKASTGDNIGSLLLSGLGLFGGLLGGNKKADPTYHMPNGIIGAMSSNNVSGTQIAGHQNIIGSILNMVAQSGVGSLLTGGGASQSGKGGFFGNLFSGAGNMFSGSGSEMSSSLGGGEGGLFSLLSGLFKEGGYSTDPVMSRLVSAHTFRDVPHFAEGGVTSGGIPAILHPDEAVIPLSRGRKVPIEGDFGNGPINVSSNITVVAPNPDGFRKARGAIARDQNRSLRRAASRNLTGGK